MNDKFYLGDGIYAECNGWHIILSAENENDASITTKIYLEDTVLQALIDYARRIGWMK